MGVAVVGVVMFDVMVTFGTVVVAVLVETFGVTGVVVFLVFDELPPPPPPPPPELGGVTTSSRYA